MSARNHAKASRAQRRGGRKSLESALISSPARRRVPIKGPVVPRTEVKYVDVAAAQQAADTTGTIVALNLIAEGVDNTQRVGREAYMLSVAIKGLVFPTPATATLPQDVRFLLVWDNATNGVLPLITDVLTSASPYAFPNVSNIGRFTILHDQSFALGPYTAALADRTAFVLDAAVKLDTSTRFSGTTAAIASMQDGTLLAITVGSLVPGATAGNILYAARISFLDES